MKNTYRALEVSKYILNRCIDEGCPISNLQLQKILYYVQAAFLLEKNRPLYEDDIVAWRYGPVVINVYSKYRILSNKKIDQKQMYEAEFTDEEKSIIDRVVKAKCGLSAYDLVEATHEEDPWKNASLNEVISIDSICDYFSKGGNSKRIWERKRVA